MCTMDRRCTSSKPKRVISFEVITLDRDPVTLMLDRLPTLSSLSPWVVPKDDFELSATSWTEMAMPRRPAARGKSVRTRGAACPTLNMFLESDLRGSDAQLSLRLAGTLGC